MKKPKTIGEKAAQTGLVTKEEADYLDLAAGPMHAFERALGGRVELIAALAIDASPKIRNLVEMLLDTRFDNRSLGWLAQAADISLTDLLRSYRNAMLTKAQMQATAVIAHKLPAIVEDVMKRAAPMEEDCPACDGSGIQTVKPTRKCPDPDPTEITCTLCKGKKTLWRMPELDRQRLALELGELIKSPRGGPTVVQQFNMASPPIEEARSNQPGSFERVQKAVSDILYGRGVVIDVTPEDPEPR